MKPILECKGLTKQYNNHVNALTNLNLVLERGQIIGLLGPNGSGKTTLIKLINDLLIPTEGQVLIDGMVVKVGGDRCAGAGHHLSAGAAADAGACGPDPVQ